MLLSVEGDNQPSRDYEVRLEARHCSAPAGLRIRSERARSHSITSMRTTETISSTTAAAVIVGEMFSLTPLKI